MHLKASTASNPLVLIVEESPAHSATVRGLLESAGCRVQAAATSRRGLQLAQELGPDLVLIDSAMSDFNGYQAMRRLSRCKSTGHIPVVLTSARAGQGARAWGLRQGARAYLEKPYSETQLLSTVREVLGTDAPSSE